MSAPFDKSVFVNCPFDEEFAPILQAIAFCITYLGFSPRFAPENADNAVPRLDRILALVESSKYGIHDLSRCKSGKKGEYVRMNMPFELGVDYACLKFGREGLNNKAILVLEHSRYDYQKALSDISGWDVEHHGGDYKTAIRCVRNWLVAKAGADRVGPSRIELEYMGLRGNYFSSVR